MMYLAYNFLVFRVVHILDNNRPQYETEEEELKFQFKMIQLLKLDLQKAVEFHNKLFVE